MEFSLMFFVNSVLLGIGLAMDAFSVSLVNGLKEPKMKLRKMFKVSGTFAFFQAIMPLIGWFLVHLMVERFTVISKYIPFIALVLLLFIGGKMIFEGGKNDEAANKDYNEIGSSTLLVQGIATSIDALSVGFTISNYNVVMAIIASLIISIVTLIICIIGIRLGKIAGNHIRTEANLFGGFILILIGLEIFLSSAF